jgi:subtilisin family serine protease
MGQLLQKFITRTFILAALGFLALPAFSQAQTVTSERGFEVIVSAASGGTDQESIRDIDALLKSPQIANVRYVFSPDEQRMLRSVGKTALAASRKFTLPDELDFARLAAHVRSQNWRIRIEPAEIRFLVNQPLPQSPANTKTSSNTGAFHSTPNGASRSSANFEALLWALRNTGQKIAIALDDLTSYFVNGIAGEDIGLARSAPESSDRSRKITIAVLDSGVDFGHPEMADQLYENEPECRALAQHTKCLKDAASATGASSFSISSAKKLCDQQFLGKDFDGNGYPLDCSGWNLTGRSAPGSTVWGDNDARDNIGHGTHIAGILSASNKDGGGVFGVIQNSRILPVKVITASPTEPVRPKEVGGPTLHPTSGPATASTTLPAPNETDLKAERGLGDLVARGILYSLRSGAQIINMSLGWPADVDSNLMTQMIDLARSRGVLIVAAAGNDGTDALIRPCIFEGVICVASHDPDGAISHFSNHGTGVDIAAPGLGILSIFPTSLTSRIFTDRIGYEIKNGTSMAAPYVAGILARLLNAGFSASEAQARLLVGIRSTKPNPRFQRSKSVLVQTGNADLELALKAAPRPFLFPTTKKPILAKWNRLDQSIKFSIELENYWTSASDVTIHPSMISTQAGSQEVSIRQSVLRQGKWMTGEKRKLSMDLDINSKRMDSELLISLQIRGQDAATGKTFQDTRYVSVEVVAMPSAEDKEIEVKSYLGDRNLISLIPKSSLRTIKNLDGQLNQDYLAVYPYGTKTKLILLEEGTKEDGSSFRVEKSREIESPTGSLLVLQRIDLNGDNKSDYVFVWKQNPNASTRYPTFNFRFFDRDLNPLELEFDGKRSAEANFGNMVSVITDKFQWIKSGKRRFPAWISRGTTPDAEKPAYDPWNPSPLDLPNFRFYVWSNQGLRTISNAGKTPVAFFPPSREDLKSGKLKALWVSGTGTDQVYEVSEVFDNAVQSSRLADFGGIRTIRPTMIAPIFDLSSSGLSEKDDIAGAAFFSESYRAAQRVTGFSSRNNVFYDAILNPLSKTDAVATVIAGFIDDQQRDSSLTVSQTIYEMQVHETKRNGATEVVASTSLKKFSFMPGFFFQKLFFPLVGLDSNSQLKIPLIYLAQGLGTGNAMEVTAVKREFGKIVGLSRPARLRLMTPQGCESMGDPLDASGTVPARVAYICEDRVMFVPLIY